MPWVALDHHWKRFPWVWEATRRNWTHWHRNSQSGRADPLPQPIDPQPPQPNSHSLANSEQRDAKEVLVIVRRLQVADFWCEKRMEEG